MGFSPRGTFLSLTGRHGLSSPSWNTTGVIDITNADLRGFPRLLKILRSRKVPVGTSGVQQRLDIFPVSFDALALEKGAFVPGEAEPAQCVYDCLGVFRLRSIPIGILNTKDERSLVLFRKQPIEERRTSTTHMKIPRRGRSKANSYSHFLDYLRHLMSKNIRHAD